MRPGSVSPAPPAPPQHVHGSSGPRLGGAAPGTTVSATQTSRSSSDSRGQPASSVPASDATSSEAEASTGSSPCATGLLGCISRYPGGSARIDHDELGLAKHDAFPCCDLVAHREEVPGAMPSDLRVQPFTHGELLGAVLLPAFADDRDVLAIGLEHAHDALVAGSRLSVGSHPPTCPSRQPPPSSYGVLLTKDERRYE